MDRSTDGLKAQSSLIIKNFIIFVNVVDVAAVLHFTCYTAGIN